MAVPSPDLAHPSPGRLDDAAPWPEGESLSADAFKALFRAHPAGVAVVTAAGAEGPVALTVSSLSSVSVDPPLLVFSLSELSSAASAILAAATVVVHLLDADDLPLARRGAARGIDRFTDASSWFLLPTGEPVFTGTRAWVRCAMAGSLAAGASTVIVGRALEARITRDVEPRAPGNALVYHNRAWHRLDAGTLLPD